MMKGFTFPTLLSFSVAAAIGGSGYVSSVFARSSPEGHAAAWQCMSTEDNDWHCSPSPGQPYTLTLAEVKELRLESPRSFAKTALKETDVSSSTASLAKDWDLKSESELLALVANDISEDEAKNPELLLQWLERAKKLHSWTEPTTSERVNHLIDTQEQKQAMKHFPADSRLSRLEAQLLSTEINNGDVPKQVLAERDKEVDIFGTPINRQPYIAAQRIMQAQIQAQVQAASFSFVQKQAPAPPAPPPPPPPPPPPKQSFYQKQTAVANQLLAKQVTGRAQNYVPTPSSMSTPEATSAYAGNQYQSASTPPLSNVARASVELGTRATALRVQSRMQSDMNMPRNRGYSMSNNTLPPEVIQPQGAAPQYHSDPRNPPNPRNVQASRVYEQQQIQLSQFDYKTGEGANLNERPPSAGDYQPAQTARKQSSKLSPYQGQAGWNMAEQSAVSYMPASQQIPVQSPAQEHSSRYRADERMAPSLPKYSAEHARPQTVANNAPQTRFSYKTDRGASLNTSSQSAGNYQKSPMAQPSRYRADERMAPSLPQYSAEPAWSQAAAENTRQSQFGYETSRDASLNTPPQSAGNYQQAQSSRYRADERMASSLPKYNAEPAWSQETAENTRQSQFSYKTGRDANLYTPPQSAGNYQPASMVQPLAQEKPYRYRADERMAPSLPKYSAEHARPQTVANNAPQTRFSYKTDRGASLNTSSQSAGNYQKSPMAQPSRYRADERMAPSLPQYSAEPAWSQAAAENTRQSQFGYETSRDASLNTPPQSAGNYQQAQSSRYRADERMASSLPKYNAEPAWSQETAENTRQSQFSYKTGRDANLYTPPQSAGNYQPASMVQPLAQEKPYRYRADERMAPSLPKYNVESVWPKTVAVSIAQQKLNSAYARTSMLNQSPPILSNDRFKHAFDPPAAAPPKSKQVKAVAATMPVNSIERFKLKAAEPDTVKSSYQPRASRPSVASPTTAPTYDRYEQPVDNRYRKVPNAEGKSNHQSADKAYIQPSQYAGGAAQTIKPMGVERFLNAPKSNLTIQWLATTQPAQIMRLQQRFPALRDASVVSFRQQGKIWHVLLSGIYPDKRSANQMLSQKSWKHIVRILNPWARSLGGLHKLDLILPKTTPQSQERYSPAFPQGEYTIQWASARTIEEIREIQASYPQLSGADAIEVSGRNGVSYALVQGRYQNNLTAMDVLRQPRLAKLANDLHSMIRSMASIKNSRLLSQTTFSR